MIVHCMSLVARFVGDRFFTRVGCFQQIKVVGVGQRTELSELAGDQKRWKALVVVLVGLVVDDSVDVLSKWDIDADCIATQHADERLDPWIVGVRSVIVALGERLIKVPASCDSVELLIAPGE